jgi:hypothetical protein
MELAVPVDFLATQGIVEYLGSVGFLVYQVKMAPAGSVDSRASQDKMGLVGQVVILATVV